MNTPFLDSNGNPMEKGYFYSITIMHTVFPEIQYLSKKTNTMMMRFKIINDPYALLIRYDPNNRPTRLNRNKTNITDNEDDSDNDFSGGKRKNRKSNKRRKTNKNKKRKSIKRRK